jgi:tRNA pseudouridine38-40 synthase
MPRYRITIEYDGTGLAGWQRQKDHPSVQQHIEEAIYKFCGEDIRIQGAGRTDAGVHAYAQVATFDLVKAESTKTVMNAINFHLGPARIAIYECEEVSTDFNARFSALARSYVYRIVNRHARLALDNGYAWHVKRELDDAAMQEAANVLIGKHDFSSFRAAACQAKSPIKTLSKLDVIRSGDMIECQVAAPSFLHNQVRAMVGTLSLVGAGQWTAADVQAALEAKDRQKAGPNAPAHGLYFEAVTYDN